MTKLVTDPDPPLEAWPRDGELVIIDLEWTAWEGSLARQWSEPWEFREVVALGAVRVDAERFEISAEMELFVRPVKNPDLSSYTEKLTGITTSFLREHGMAFDTALAKLVAFASDTIVVANGSDGAVLRENCLLTSTEFPFSSGRIRTIRPLLSVATGRPAAELVSAELPALLGIGPLPAQHGALADTRAIASALAWLRAARRL